MRRHLRSCIGGPWGISSRFAEQTTERYHSVTSVHWHLSFVYSTPACVLRLVHNRTWHGPIGRMEYGTWMKSFQTMRMGDFW